MAKTQKRPSADQLPVEIRYDGPTDLLEVTQDGVTIARGKTGYVSDEAAAHLVGCSYADVTVVSGNPPMVWPGTHEKLDRLADQLDIEWPQPENGQPPLTIADKQSALEQAGFQPDGTRRPGDTDDPKEEAA